MINKVLIAVDGSRNSQKALKFGCDLLSSNKEGKIYLVHVVRRSRVPADIKRFIEEEDITEAPGLVFLERVGAKIMVESAELVKKHCGGRAETVILQGNPAEQIAKFAEDNSIDVVVTGSKGLSELRVAMLGSVARKICHLSPCTCVTVK